ncbi:hypothetical protein CEXT_25631 [Caerostris extrusa]|uniref:Uncharacterized protein n=1 Tax=Caerostris extrusa TaxID=172846 RepID=A0AAV4Y5C4_CAEEX|nr:hypothetical protein CEXT_25631 [Caerostris extrusa]
MIYNFTGITSRLFVVLISARKTPTVIRYLSSIYNPILINHGFNKGEEVAIAKSRPFSTTPGGFEFPVENNFPSRQEHALLGKFSRFPPEWNKNRKGRREIPKINIPSGEFSETGDKSYDFSHILNIHAALA